MLSGDYTKHLKQLLSTQRFIIHTFVKDEAKKTLFDDYLDTFQDLLEERNSSEKVTEKGNEEASEDKTELVTGQEKEEANQSEIDIKDIDIKDTIKFDINSQKLSQTAEESNFNGVSKDELKKAQTHDEMVTSHAVQLEMKIDANEIDGKEEENEMLATEEMIEKEPLDSDMSKYEF